jgi:hypothetical protein
MQYCPVQSVCFLISRHDNIPRIGARLTAYTEINVKLRAWADRGECLGC